MGERRERGEGAFRWKRKRAEVRLYLGEPYGRKAFLLTPSITDDARAAERAALLADFAVRLRATGRVPLALPLLERLAAGEGPREVKATAAALEVVLSGEAAEVPTDAATFGDLADRWTSGELARLYPDHVKSIDHTVNKYRLDKHVLPMLREVPIARFTLAHAQEVMRRLPRELSAASRRQVAQLMHRILSMAVFPMTLISVNPLPRGFLPSPGKEKAKACIYPDEDRTLLGCAAVPLVDRVTYGFLHREGMRASEAALLEKSDIDLQRGAVVLDANKTDDPRAWALRPDVTRALRAWFAVREAQGDTDPRVFPRSFDHAADRFRAHLEAAGIDRPQLFERSAERRPIRFHDTRATFITIALANGKTEAWIADRTGHKSSDQINRYRRAARTIAELHMDDLAPLDLAIPELAAVAGPEGGAAPDGAEGGPDDAGPGAGDASGSARGPAGASSHEGTSRDGRTREIVHVRRRLRPSTAFRFQRGHSREGSSPSLRTSTELLGFSEETAAASEAETDGAGPERAPKSSPGSTGQPADPGTVAPLAGEVDVLPGTNARGAAVAQLAGVLASLAAAGDLEGARTLHETIGRLLGPVAAPGEGAAVVDLDAERKRRAGR